MGIDVQITDVDFALEKCRFYFYLLLFEGKK
ncbi:MAG: hypothetical protein JWP12_3167 [Bacteroidetes bacterium]|nr:hypothetical protein [Bacteroidota bacterium]